MLKKFNWYVIIASDKKQQPKTLADRLILHTEIAVYNIETNQI